MSVLPPTEALRRLHGLDGGAFVLARVAATPGAWVVGGAVRDALLGLQARELDIVVEGEVGPLLDALGGSRVIHERFGTATVTLEPSAAGATGRAVTVDVARARTETYAAPGALPDVRDATVAEDLHRRDVSVNAIALRPADDGADAELLALPGALDDLRDGILRVLHDRSFTDDPTRLWRVARYAARLGFAVEERTAALAQRADPRTAGGPRLGNELRLALREPDPCAALTAAHALNARLMPVGVDTAPRRLAPALALLDGEGRADLVTLAACCAGVDAGTLVLWLDALGFSAAEREIVAAGSRASTYGPLLRARTDAEIARAARGAPPEVVALAGGPQAERWLKRLRQVRLEITGDDLKAAGVPEGPLLGRALAAVLDARLDGDLPPGRDAELEAALAIVGREAAG